QAGKTAKKAAPQGAAFFCTKTGPFFDCAPGPRKRAARRKGRPASLLLEKLRKGCRDLVGRQQVPVALIARPRRDEQVPLGIRHGAFHYTLNSVRAFSSVMRRISSAGRPRMSASFWAT